MTRTGLVALLARQLEGWREDDGALGVMLVRLQRVREFGLFYGYAAGDALGEAALARIASVLRPQDTLVRVGLHEYVALLPGLRGHHHAALAGGRVVRAFEAPLQVGARAAPVAVKIGISVHPDHGRDAERLLHNAETAYGASRRDSEDSALYDDTGTPPLIPYEALHQAIAGNLLQVHLQPMLDLRTRRIVAAESLARWHDDALGPVAPDRFIPLAEETGLISPLTRWSLNATLRHAAAARAIDPTLAFSINLSPRVFGERDLVAQITSSLGVWGIPASAITLEVTENALMEDPKLSLRRLEDLRMEGLGISIDDFGAGYSSLAYLKFFPATELKIDRGFIGDLRDDRRSIQLVRSIIDLGHHLKMRVVAEGVEDAESLAMLAEMGCDGAQGYFIQRPLPAEAFIEGLKASQPKASPLH